MKKTALAISVLTISCALFVYRAEFLQFARHLESVSQGTPLLTALILIALKTIVAPLGFPGTPLTLLSGALLGNFFGTIAALIGNTIGATLAFLLSRYLLKEYVQKNLVSKYPKMRKYEERLEEKAFSTVVVLRLIPLFPFNALNFLLGVSNIPVRTYALASFVGMIPGTALFVYFGESLRMRSIINIIFAVLGIAALTYLGKMYEKRF